MIVMAVIVILAAIAIPAYRNYIAVSKQSSADSILEQFSILLETHRAENGWMCPTCNADGNYTYGYTEDGAGNENYLPAANRISSIYPDFQPKNVTNTDPTLYHYTLVIQVTNCATGCQEVATITATPQVGRGAPTGNRVVTYQ